MKKFIFKLLALLLVVILLFSVLLFGVPADKNAYLCEYVKKVALIEKTETPRLIFIGTSSLAYDINSKQISDSLGIPVINLGLNRDIGSRYYLDDFLQYIKKGDVVVISPSYLADFIDGGKGIPDALIDLMISTQWRRVTSFDAGQLFQIISGVPYFCLRNLMRLVKSPKNGFTTGTEHEEYMYVASGFNEYGDESSHWHLPYKKGYNTKAFPVEILTKKDATISDDYLIYLKDVLAKYAEKGASVILMPEINSESYYQRSECHDIERAMANYGMAFDLRPDDLVFSDSYGYDGWCSNHFNYQGVQAVSEKMVQLIKSQNVVNPQP